MMLRFPEDTLGLVNKVVFHLHETFSEPVVEVDLFPEVAVELLKFRHHPSKLT